MIGNMPCLYYSTRLYCRGAPPHIVSTITGIYLLAISCKCPKIWQQKSWTANKRPLKKLQHPWLVLESSVSTAKKHRSKLIARKNFNLCTVARICVIKRAHEGPRPLR